MRIESPALNLDTDASVETITAAVSKLKGKEIDAFLILSASDLTYMQVEWTNDGYGLEYQAGSTKFHFVANELLSADDVRFILIEYLQGADSWKSKYSFSRLDFLRENEKKGGGMVTTRDINRSYEVIRIVGTIVDDRGTAVQEKSGCFSGGGTVRVRVSLNELCSRAEQDLLALARDTGGDAVIGASFEHRVSVERLKVGNNHENHNYIELIAIGTAVKYK